MFTRKAASLAAVVVATAATPAAAQTFFDTYMASKPQCFARAYLPNELRAKPRQTITNFFVWHARPDPRRNENPGTFEVEFGFRVKQGQVLYSGRAVCRDQGGPIRCAIEADGGAFTMEPNAAYRDGLRITIDRMEVEGRRGFSGDIAKGDNRVILANPAPITACSTRIGT